MNAEQHGAVMASPDHSTQGGDYYYHWMRDGGLSIAGWLEVNDMDVNLVRDVVDPYVGWVGFVQKQPDPNNDVRIEPKFYIETGQPYDDGWCRPQTDGPALRGMALSKYGIMKLDMGDTSGAQQIWDLVKFDMEWVVPNWNTDGCDLWEEVHSTDFYWNRAAFVYCLNIAADFADRMGDLTLANTYRSTASTILPTALSHYDAASGYIYETKDSGREIDSSVLHAVATFGEYVHRPESPEVAKTIMAYTTSFCGQYPISASDVSRGISGVLMGRYPGDTYAGGNPWQLLTAVTAEVFYLASQNIYTLLQTNPDDPITVAEYGDWMKLLHLVEGPTVTLSTLASAMLEAGDAELHLLHDYIEHDLPRIDEQIDKNTGAQWNAESLTWSMANTLHAIKAGEKADQMKATFGGSK